MKWTAQRQEEALETGFWRNLHRVRVAHIVEQVEAEGQQASRPLAVLDVGCGDGVITKRLRERFPRHRIEALDADPVRLGRARASCGGVVFREGDAHVLPYPDETFDVVLCHHLLEHVTDDLRVLRECRRVLTAGGLFVLGIPHEGGAIGRILRRLHKQMYTEGEHVRFYTIEGMRRLILAEGFVDVRCAKFGFLVPQYHLHVLFTWNPLTFHLGHLISQHVDTTADSLIFVARKAMNASLPSIPGRERGAAVG